MEPIPWVKPYSNLCDPFPNPISNPSLPYLSLPFLESTYLHVYTIGGILWTITLYYGVFQPLFQKESVFFSQPSEWLLYPLAKGLKKEEEEWFVNFKEGAEL